MTTDDAMEVHFCLRLLDRPCSLLILLCSNQAWELHHKQCWSGNHSNTLKGASLKWMKLGCAVPVFPLEQQQSQLLVGAVKG